MPRNHEKNIVFLHGWLDNAASYASLLKLLQDEPFANIYVYEFAGHGWSANRSSDSHYHFIDYVYDVIAFISSLSLEHCCLVGHSMGGMVASVVAASRPDLVNSVVMLEACGPIIGSGDTLGELRQGFASRHKLANQANRLVQPKLLYQLRAQVGDLSIEAAQLLIDRDLLKTEKGYERRSDPRLKALSPIKINEQQVVDILQAICCPTLVILGEQGYKWIKQQVLSRQAYIKQLTILEVQGNHHFHMQSPERLHQLLENFV
ncbi:alpha/beta fold hydrolase [Algibacillus agarilyticus]|uniref:alpha/beta fold hydrolase n=1 Tax=Algibacillus agarilyticus TaxID=2234133 RepID=UPI0013002391|nr:alpha/beta hydrolase [Algibacillus agarilyticus]